MNIKAKQQIIELLKNAESPLSGEAISKHIGVSRTMIWKHIQSLLAEGYEIKAIKKKGYVLHQISDKLSEMKIQTQLQTEKYARQILVLDSCGSTQKVAGEVLLNQSCDGFLVISEEQTDGKGRLNRQWASTKGKGLWMSWIIKPAILPHEAPPITLVAALAVAAAIEKVTKVQVDIKWPNDLLINGKKVGGILTELQSTPEQIEAIIMGIGLNVNHTPNDFDEELSQIATSLAIVSEQVIDRVYLLAEIALELETAIQRFEQRGFQPFILAWEKQSTMIGKTVTARTMRETIKGTALGINEYGALLVDTQTGVKSLFSGDVTLSDKLEL